MNEYFNWSNVYSVKHSQGRYLIFTVERDNNHAGVMLPAGMDDIWNIAGSRLIDKMNSTEGTTSSHDEVLQVLNDWMKRNLVGDFSVELVKDMYPPIEFENEA